MTTALADFFASLPNTSQAAIIASLVTLFGGLVSATIALSGVYLTHRGQEKRFAKQLAHEREKNRIEREMSLRKEVYLEAADALVAGIDVISRYANLHIPYGELNANFSAKRGAIAKTHLIGSQDTVNAVVTFMGELDRSILDLAQLRLPLVQAETQIKLLGDQITTFSKERDRMLELMKQLNFEGNKDPGRWHFVNSTFEFEKGRIQATIESQKLLGLKFSSDLASFAAECISASVNVSELLIPAVKAIRSELELPFDEVHYRQLIEASLMQQKELMEKLRSNIESSIRKSWEAVLPSSISEPTKS